MESDSRYFDVVAGKAQAKTNTLTKVARFRALVLKSGLPLLGRSWAIIDGYLLNLSSSCCEPTH